METELHDMCKKCGNELEVVQCWQCGGDGVNGHDCGEDTCSCRNPKENVTCDVCDGKGSWTRCYSCNPMSRDELRDAAYG